MRFRHAARKTPRYGKPSASETHTLRTVTLICAPIFKSLRRMVPHCARGEMENRIKEQQLMLFADRTSTHWMRSNQIRLWFSSVAYVLVNALRRVALGARRWPARSAGRSV